MRSLKQSPVPTVLLGCMAALFVLLLLHQDVRKQVNMIVCPENKHAWIEEYKTCQKNALRSMTPVTLIKRLVPDLKKCEDDILPDKQFRIEVLPQGREAKHARLPVRNFTEDERCVVVVLGIGQEIDAEAKVRKLYPQKCQFYGADPTPEPNKKLIEGIGGTYFQGAISSTTGSQQAILQTKDGYTPYTINHTALRTYIEEYVGVNEVIDYLSIDIEGGEMELFPSLMRGGLLDELDIHVCQLNMELHLIDASKRDNTQGTYDFLLNSAVDERFIFLKATFPPYKQRITYYALNVQSSRCRGRYIAA